MKNGVTESVDFQVEEIKKKYSDGEKDFEVRKVVADCLKLVYIIENRGKDPRVTIELAKLKKENSSLKKEFSRFFPSKNSIETASKKMENLFQVDSVSLLRYENSELHEKNSKLDKEVENLQEKIRDLEKTIESDLASIEKLKVALTSIRVDNSSLIMQNREVVKRNKLLEEQSQIVENLQKKLRGALLGTGKGEVEKVKEKEKIDGFSQTDEYEVKPSKLLSRLATKNLVTLSIDRVNEIQCEGNRKRFSLIVCRNVQSLAVRASLRVVIEKPEKVKAKPKLVMYDGESIGISWKRKSFAIVKTSISVVASYERPGKPTKVVVKKPKLSEGYLEAISIAPVPSKKPLLATTKAISTSLVPIKPKKSTTFQVSKTTSASLVPKNPASQKAKAKPKPLLRTSTEISLTIPTCKIPFKVSLSSQKIYSHFSKPIYIPSLIFSQPSSLEILGKIQKVSIEFQVSLSCKKRPHRIKLCTASIFNISSNLTLSTFPRFSKSSNLEIVQLRRFGYTPEVKNTDDEETKSASSPTRRRVNRQPVRKPAIEEYFNLVCLI